MTEAGFTPRQLRAEGCPCSQQMTELQRLGLHWPHEAKHLTATSGGLSPTLAAVAGDYSLPPVSSQNHCTGRQGPGGHVFLGGRAPPKHRAGDSEKGALR